MYGTGKDMIQMSLHTDAEIIIKDSIKAVLPDEAVKKVLMSEKIKFGDGKLILVAIGKAAWQMANAAAVVLGNKLDAGVVVTKYQHVKGKIPKVTCFEAGHPVPDENSFLGTRAAIELVKNLTAKDTVLFLISGGGSALFEEPLISGQELAAVTRQLLACGADIVEMNTIRKRLSAVKGGRFAKLCEPARVYSIVLSDILGDPLDMIASGPAYPDSSTSKQAIEIAEKCHLELSEKVWELLESETPKEVSNVETFIMGSVRNLCHAAQESCKSLGYKPFILTDQLSCEAKEAGNFLAAIAKTYQNTKESIAFIAGGETVVHLTGKGKGGRNQELALAAAEGIAGLNNTAIFSIGSDGTDGPTDAAGGYVDQETFDKLTGNNISVYQVLQENDAYHALEQCDGLIKTGATGTNVNDVSVLLIKR